MMLSEIKEEPPDYEEMDMSCTMQSDDDDDDDNDEEPNDTDDDEDDNEEDFEEDEDIDDDGNIMFSDKQSETLQDNEDESTDVSIRVINYFYYLMREIYILRLIY